MDFVNDYRRVVEGDIPDEIAASWKEHHEYLESALNPEDAHAGVEITIYTNGMVGLLVNGFQRIREDSLEEFSRALDAFVLGVKVARDEATDADYL